MIKAVDNTSKTVAFTSDDKKKNSKNETRILPNTVGTRVKQGFQKTSSAFLDYPVKGLRGDINSNFYEFLTMGTVPYLLGSGMFMVGFNCVKGSLSPKARLNGKKMGLGVVLYGVMKNLSKHLVTKPVELATGVDTEMPYENIVYPLPKEAGEDASIEIQHQQRKIFDSKEFYRKDLLHRDYYDKIAKKLGFGEDLNDSITEVSPAIQNIVAMSNLAKSIASYSWAAVGVMLASQDSWSNFFDAFTNRQKQPNVGDSKLVGGIKNFGKNTWNVTKAFGTSLVESSKSLWNGNPAYSGFKKHAGKTLVSTAVALTVVLTANVITKAKDMTKNKNKNTIDKTKESTVI
ncbi:MAG: hypothetical protein E7Z89_00505 [Cyanobacteria bacterium SIG28]|nr:hypothetical protein [Cyanobacteria bacterium SIG28]